MLDHRAIVKTKGAKAKGVFVDTFLCCQLDGYETLVAQTHNFKVVSLKGSVYFMEIGCSF
jgi:hypothetical protein